MITRLPTSVMSMSASRLRIMLASGMDSRSEYRCTSSWKNFTASASSAMDRPR
ncbi:hypothetical protein D3C83_13020 [compost metagenome]